MTGSETGRRWDHQDELTERMRARFEQYHPTVNVYEIMAALADEVRQYDRPRVVAPGDG